jgi:hypothetical protein
MRQQLPAMAKAVCKGGHHRFALGVLSGPSQPLLYITSFRVCVADASSFQRVVGEVEERICASLSSLSAAHR